MSGQQRMNQIKHLPPLSTDDLWDIRVNILKVTQAVMAEYLGRSHTGYRQAESGRTKLPLTFSNQVHLLHHVATGTFYKGLKEND